MVRAGLDKNIVIEKAVDGVRGDVTWEAICRTFYGYATENLGVFLTML